MDNLKNKRQISIPPSILYGKSSLKPSRQDLFVEDLQLFIKNKQTKCINIDKVQAK
jgi:hypothetical protein